MLHGMPLNFPRCTGLSVLRVNFEVKTQSFQAKGPHEPKLRISIEEDKFFCHFFTCPKSGYNREKKKTLRSTDDPKYHSRKEKDNYNDKPLFIKLV